MSHKTIRGKTYDIGTLNAWEQFEVVRRIGPLLAALMTVRSSLIKDVAPIMADLKAQAIAAESGEAAPEGSAAIEAVNRLMGVVIKPFSELPTEDSKYVTFLCLSRVKVALAGDTAWNHVTVGEQFTDQSMTMPVMLSLIFHVIMENMAGFFAESPLNSAQGGAAARGSTP